MKAGVTLNYLSAQFRDIKIDPASKLFHPEEWLHLEPADLALLLPEEKARLSALEAAHFFSVNVIGEKYGMETMRKTPSAFFESVGLKEYRDRLLAEEEVHTEVFLKGIKELEAAPESVASIYGEVREIDSLPGLMEFFSNIYLFEFVTTYVSVVAMKDDCLDPAVREIHRFHWSDERHHLSLTRKVLLEVAAELGSEERELVRRRCIAWLAILARSFFPTRAIRELEKMKSRPFLDRAFEFAGGRSRWVQLFALSRQTLDQILASPGVE